MESLWQFSEKHLAAVQKHPDLVANLHGALSRGIMMTSSYSGYRTEEMAAAALVVALNKHLEGSQGSGFQHHSVCDNDLCCQQLALRCEGTVLGDVPESIARLS